MNEMKKVMVEIAEKSNYANKQDLLKEIENVFTSSNNESEVIQNIEKSRVFGEEVYNLEKTYKFYVEFKKIFLSSVLSLAFK